MNDIIQELVQAIKNNQRKTATKAYIKDYIPEEISEKNFKSLPSEKSNKKIAFIDGGNTEIIETPSTSLQLIRVYYNIFQNNKKIKSKKIEFYTLTTAEAEGKEIIYKTKIIGTEIIECSDLTINSNDTKLKEGTNRISISKIGEIARKFAEWAACNDIMDELEEGDCIVKDGILDEDYENEEKYTKEVLENAKRKRICIAGLAKTSRIFCDNGQVVNNALMTIAAPGEWDYYPIVKEKNIHYVKLNKNSKHNFRLDVEGDETELLRLLKENANEATFPGYPYGLVDADRFARVTNQEKQYLLMKIKSTLGKDWGKIEEQLSTQNAHEILDTIS